jgi:hypothetical protein
MRLERNIRTDGKCKYDVTRTATGQVVDVHREPFFVLMLKDQFAAPALRAYAAAVLEHANGLEPGEEQKSWREYYDDLMGLLAKAEATTTKLPD